MKWMLRVVAAVLAAAALGLGAFAWGLNHGWLELPMAELEARYRLPESQFLDVDGVRVHYVVSGEGPPLVLLHASWLSLRSWDALADILDDHYRVVRLDLSGAGLTADDPSDRYGIERNIELMEGVLAHLGVQQFSLVGTSSGGIAAFRYAAAHPERVERLVLINSAGLPRTPASNPNKPPPGGLVGWFLSRWRPESFWAKSLAENFVPPHQPSPELVQMTYDMNRRAGWRRIGLLYLKGFSTGDPQAVLAGVKAPTLVLWGLDNHTLTHLEADVFARWLTGTTAVVKKYPGVGHYAYIEEPALVAADIAGFLSAAPPPPPAPACAAGG
jgi:pimeloyl-ACP methyl ester carboxylesterase